MQLHGESFLWEVSSWDCPSQLYFRSPRDSGLLNECTVWAWQDEFLRVYFAFSFKEEVKHDSFSPAVVSARTQRVFWSFAAGHWVTKIEKLLGFCCCCWNSSFKNSWQSHLKKRIERQTCASWLAKWLLQLTILQMIRLHPVTVQCIRNFLGQILAGLRLLTSLQLVFWLCLSFSALL